MEKGKKRKTWWLIPIIVLTKFTKLSQLVLLAKAFKAIKAVKLAMTFFSMAISALLYSFLMGPEFAIGFVLLLFVHEMGHVIALRIKGYPVTAPVFIPFLGAAIFVPKFDSKQTEAFVGFGGPLLGIIGSIVLFGVWAISGHPLLLLLLSYNFFFINLFNLVPIRPLDGGRITQIAGRFFAIIGGVIVIILPLALKNPGLFIIWILVLMDVGINARIKSMIGVACQILMISLMIGGYSEQGLFLDIVDNVFACLLNFIMFVIASSAGKKAIALAEAAKKSEEPVAIKEEAQMPQVSFRTKVLWVLAYVGLILISIGFMIWQEQFLPLAIKNR